MGDILSFVDESMGMGVLNFEEIMTFLWLIVAKLQNKNVPF